MPEDHRVELGLEDITRLMTESNSVSPDDLAFQLENWGVDPDAFRAWLTVFVRSGAEHEWESKEMALASAVIAGVELGYRIASELELRRRAAADVGDGGTGPPDVVG